MAPLQNRQQLKDGDFERRMGFCECLLIQNRNPRFVHDLIIGDEAGFPVNGKVNTRSQRAGTRVHVPSQREPGKTDSVDRVVWRM